MLFKMATQTTTYRYNHPEKLFQEIASQLFEPKMKQLILRRTISPMLKIVDTHANVLCQHEDCAPPKFQHNIYEWSIVKFKRRMQSHKRYIDELYHLDPRTLAILKISTDFKNLNDLLKLLYDESIATMLTELKGCKKLQNIQEDLGVHHMVQSKYLERLTQDYYAFSFHEERVMNEITTRQFKTMDECNDVALVSDPIFARYQYKYIRLDTDFQKSKLELPVKQLQTDIQNVALDSIRKLAISETTQGYFGNQISDLREKINYWSDKYDKDFEKINQTVQEKKWNLKALQLKWQEHRDRMEFFREEVQRHLEGERIAAELHEKQLQEQELIRAMTIKSAKQRKRNSRVKSAKRPKK